MSRSPLKRILICLCVLSLSVVAIAPRPVHAQPETGGIWGWIQWIMKVAAGDEEISFDVASWVTSAFTGLMSHTTYVATVGCPYDDFTYCAQHDFEDPNPGSNGDQCDPCRPEFSDAAYAFMPGGAFGYTSLAVEGMSEIEPPFSLALYAKDMKQNSFLGGEVYADPFSDKEAWLAGQFGKVYQDVFKEATYAFWKQMRNLAYLLFVLILIAMGFMVMLRYQVSPRVTITITSALPRIAMGLVLITFSYPIVSLAVDLIVPLTLAARNIIIDAWADAAGSLSIRGMTVADPWDYSGIVKAILANATTILGLKINLFSVIFLQIILFILFITIFLAFWAFLKRFIKLIQAGILGPIIIAWGTLPGNEEAITGWFKGILANMLALPAISLVAFAGLLILGFNPPAGDSLPLPFAYASDLFAQGITFLIGLTILWNAHKVPRKIDEAFSGGGNKR